MSDINLKEVLYTHTSGILNRLWTLYFYFAAFYYAVSFKVKMLMCLHSWDLIQP